eukprot:scaffold549_cov385-Prasinococcus_capsulatus_cf.AAC.46
MHVILYGYGSRGDCQPLEVLAHHLHECNHGVSLVVPDFLYKGVLSRMRGDWRAHVHRLPTSPNLLRGKQGAARHSCTPHERVLVHRRAAVGRQARVANSLPTGLRAMETGGFEDFLAAMSSLGSSDIGRRIGEQMARLLLSLISSAQKPVPPTPMRPATACSWATIRHAGNGREPAPSPPPLPPTSLPRREARLLTFCASCK